MGNIGWATSDRQHRMGSKRFIRIMQPERFVSCAECSPARQQGDPCQKNPNQKIGLTGRNCGAFISAPAGAAIGLAKVFKIPGWNK
jgi:hypothetical protein